MKKSVFILMLLLVLNGYSQDVYFYYYKGNKIPLRLDKTGVTLITENNFQGKSDKNYVLKKSSENISSIQYNQALSDEDYLKNVEVLNAKDDVIRANPNFMTESGQKVGVSDYFYVKLKTSKDYDILKRKAQEQNVIIVEQNKFMPLWYTLRITKATQKSTLEVANEFYEMKIFSSSQPDFLSDDRLCSNDPMFQNMWGLQNKSNSGVDIGICQAWNITQGENIKVAVLDNGIFKDHIDLKANLIPLSYNTETNSSPSQLLGDHGTHCAGTIAAAKDNGMQVVGVSPRAKLIDVSNSLMREPNSRIKRADGINWAWQNGADIISNSWGSSVRFQAIDDAIENAINRGRNGKGCVVVFATGNENTNVAYPADTNLDILSVGSITSEGKRSDFSNYGNQLDVVAPGSHILSTLPYNKTGYNSGTSMACPHVAGVAALILSVNPNLTSKEVRDIIEKTAQKVGGYNYQDRGDKPNGTWNNEMGYGLVNAYEAVKKAKSLLITPPELICSSELWGFCKRATFTIVNFPEGAEVSWRFTRGATIVEEKVPNELVIDFGTKRRAIVEAEVRVAGETYNLRYENTNNMHVRNEHVHLHIKEHLPNGEFVAEILLDERTPLTDVEAERFTILNTENCSVRRVALNRYYIKVLRGNAKVSFSISAVPEPCEEDIATFALDYIEPSSLIATDESQIISTLPKNDIANCTTKGLLQGEVYVYRWQGARRVFLDFKEMPEFIPMSDEEKYQSINWNDNYSKIAEKYPNGYFECVPFDKNLSYMYPLPHIDVQPGEIHYDSTRYVGFLDWGKAWVRFVTDCKASEWELIDFSKIIHVTNGYFVSRDKGYELGGVFRITPNPASNNVYLSVFNSEQGKSGFRSASSQGMNKNVETPYKIRIYNSAGILVRSLEGKGNSAQFSVKGLPTGIYIVHFIQNGKTHKEKLIVE